jgi:hypothetical protein
MSSSSAPATRSRTFAIYGYTHRAHEAGLELQPYAGLHSWLARVEQQPGYVEDVQPYGANAARRRTIDLRLSPGRTSPSGGGQGCIGLQPMPPVQRGAWSWARPPRRLGTAFQIATSTARRFSPPAMRGRRGSSRTDPASSTRGRASDERQLGSACPRTANPRTSSSKPPPQRRAAGEPGPPRSGASRGRRQERSSPSRPRR